MKPRELLKLFAPPLIIEGYRRLRSESFGLSGNYSSWELALRDSTGYDNKIIIEKTKEALLKVKNGQAVYERDSVLLDEIQYAWPLLAGLMWVAAKTGGQLNVLDFGGSLGSTYFQNRALLDSLPEVHWNIVEQLRYVEIGNEFFEDGRLKFFTSIKNSVAASQPNAVILSGVLQYLERPYEVLGEIMKLDCEHILIDRTPFWDGDQDRLCIQNVPPSIYTASYPIWIFSMTRFISAISEKNFQVFAEFESLDRLTGPVDLVYKGMTIVRSGSKPADQKYT